ncbi:hypothetical protein ACFFJQ_07005 [Bacillus capparidis]|uniref:Lipoprotein n=1 Tax=Bacillus capparidis TaxID=1840411 RepID=A0ABS4D1L9_9BACI|nr:hypothetical protein [Bacillus capparidis]MBP1083516.1 hypothetical protein [Bacillus capparidis]MED1094714.1 hypothetical protein [Bacillus capparidis]
MRKIFYLLPAVWLLILTGCGFTTKNLDQVITDISNDETLKRFIVSIDYGFKELPEKGNESTYHEYDLNGTLVDKFDDLSKKEQYQFLASVVKVVQKNGIPNGISYEDGDFFCGEKNTCFINLIELTTSKHKYGVEYSSDSSLDLLYVDDEIVYDDSAKDGKYIDPTAEEEEVEVEEEEKWNLETADGTDWVGYDDDTKYSIVNEILTNVSNGGQTVDFDIEWFIEALDEYYGDGNDPTSSDKIIEVIAITGVAGGLIKDE